MYRENNTRSLERKQTYIKYKVAEVEDSDHLVLHMTAKGSDDVITVRVE